MESGNVMLDENCGRVVRFEKDEVDVDESR